ncbi:MAG: Cytochrome bd-I ubiquinol oxidase subunit 2 [Frankiales bacterium]|nr:Cytochrome bd-I ubiquinol oxidase subunit 2 [Frankiales bacterium]
MSDAAAAILLTGILLYVVFAGADFGAGLWGLTAGGLTRGRQPRAFMEAAIGPVWEANHVWLIFSLVVAWTSFPSAFAAAMTTLYAPLGLAALGIVLRGTGFAFRRVVIRSEQQRVASAAFEVSSIITPFFLGTVVGALASGRVPAQGGGDALRSWTGATSLLAGGLAVSASATLAAVFLVKDARLRGVVGLQSYFARRARASAAVVLVLSLVGLAVLSHDAHRLTTRLLGRGLPLLLLALVAGLGALLLLRAGRPWVAPLLAVVAVASLVLAWGIAQYPYVLGTHLSIAEAAAPRPTLVSVAVIFGAALLVCVPSLTLLYVLHQRGRLVEP